jgi:hypothetical protein
VGPLPPEHGGQQVRVAGLGGRHHLEEEVVPVAAAARTRLGQPAAEFLPAGREDLVTSRSGLTRIADGRPVEETIRRVGQLG